MGIISLRMAGNYEESMNILQALTRGTTKEMSLMRAESTRLGADMKLPNVSAKDAADAMQELGRAGLSVKDILAGTRGTLQLGLAANVGFADSAVIVARALKSFRLEGTQATRIADLFTAAANKSTAEITDVALGFQQASVRFAGTGQSIEDLTTAITIMADAGIVGSDAGTSLRTMMNKLVAPTDKARAQMKELGFSVYDAQGNMKPFPQIIRNLNSSFRGMGLEQRDAALYTIFGSDAIRAATEMMRVGEKGFLSYRKEITRGGEAQAFAEARTKGFNGAVQALGSQVETLAIELGTAMLPAATAVTRAMANFVASIDPQKIINFFAAIKNGVMFFVDLIRGSELLQAALVGLIAGFVAFKIITMVVGLVQGLAAAFALLGATMMANPVVLIAAAIIGLVAALVYAYHHSERFKEIVDRVWAALKEGAAVALEIARAVGSSLASAFNTARGIVSSLVSTVVGAWNTIRSTTTAVWNAVSDFLRRWWPLLLVIMTGGISIIVGQIIQHWSTIRNVTTTIWNAIRGVVVGIISALVGAVTSRVNAIKAVVTAVWNAIVAVTRAIWSRIKDAVMTPINALPAAIMGAIGAIRTAALALGRAIFDGIVSGVGDLASALGNKIAGAAKSALGFARSAIGASSPSKLAAEQVGKPIGEGIILGFLTGNASLPEKMKESLRKALEAGKAAVDEAKSSYSSAFSQLASDALSAFDAITQQHMTPTEMILNSAREKRAREELKRNIMEARAELTRLMTEPLDLARREGETDEEFVRREGEMRLQRVREIQAAEQRLADAEWAQREANLIKKAEQERLNYEARRNLAKRHLEGSLADLEANLAKHPEKHRFYQAKIIALLRAHGITYQSAGHALGRAFATGLRESMADVRAAVQDIAELVARYLRLRSPAQAGPLSDLDQWWNKFASTLVRGVDISPIERASLSMAGAVGPMTGTMGAYPGAPAALAGAGTVVQKHYHITGSLIAERELDDRIYEANARNANLGRTV
jgi:TP901 family phage tail tape measure protein